MEKLVAQLHGPVDAGNTVVVEHEMHVTAGSEWVIDIGPARAMRSPPARPPWWARAAGDPYPCAARVRDERTVRFASVSSATVRNRGG